MAQVVDSYRMRLTYDQLRADIQELKQRIRRLENSISGGISAGVASAAPSGGGDMLKSVYDVNLDDLVDNVGLIDPGSAFVLRMAVTLNSILANRTLTIDVDDANRTLTLEADVALDQNLRIADSPTFVTVTTTTSVVTDLINERTGGVGVTIDGVLLRDSGLLIDGNILITTPDTWNFGSPTGEIARIYVGDIGGIYFGVGQDILLSRGAANRLDLANGDDFNLVNGVLMVAATQVVTNRQAAVADVAGGAADSDGVARTAINLILARLRTHGLIAP